jgi:hypothetical protein
MLNKNCDVEPYWKENICWDNDKSTSALWTYKIYSHLHINAHFTYNESESISNHLPNFFKFRFNINFSPTSSFEQKICKVFNFTR